MSPLSQTCALALALAAMITGLGACTHALPMTPFTLEADDGSAVGVERGELVVPENRSAKGGRSLTLRFIRFRSTNPHPGSPIVYLAGGPGGSGIAAARGERLPLFLALREVADVIALDQRGTGDSNQVPSCRTRRQFPLDQPATRERYIPFVREAAAECVQFWSKRGVDLAGYNTWESAQDLDELRAALGARKISLWGISYGTHLALAALKRMPGRIDRVVLVSAEGLAQTVKLPAATDAYFARLQQAINRDPRAAAAYPDLAGLMRRVHARLASDPPVVTFTARSGLAVTMTLGDFEIQLLAGGMIADPAEASRLPAAYAMMDAGHFEPIASLLYELSGPVEFRGMPEAMDTASGISKERLERVRKQAETAILGDALNYPMPQLWRDFGVPDLGDGFRTEAKTDVPALFLTGTLDGRTYPEEHAEIRRAFSNATQVTVENAGHNLLMVAPEVTQVIVQFLKGQPVTTTRITIPPPTFP